MTGPAYGNRNRSTHRALVDLVQLALDARGISATRKKTPARLSDALGPEALDPDLSMQGVDLNVSSKLAFKLSEDLDAVTRGAEIRGVPVAAVCQWRGDRGIAESYVVMQLSGFVRLVRGDHLTPPLTPCRARNGPAPRFIESARHGPHNFTQTPHPSSESG